MSKRDSKIARVSQRDVAREAGVSRVTVSLVLAGKDQASEETRQRVLEAAKRLRYRPNLLVQGMQTGRTNTAGIIMPAVAYMQFQTQISHGVHDELVENDYIPILLFAGADASADAPASELSQIHRLVDRRVDGMIIWPAEASVPDVHFHEIWERKIPLVTVDRETTTHADHVGTDEQVGGRIAAEHLLSLGHRNIAHVSYVQRAGAMTARRDAFCKVLKEKGLDCRIISAEPDQTVAATRQLLESADRPTAIACGNDYAAIRVYTAAASVGLRIPQDLSVLGYADIPTAAEMSPPLTTIHQDPYEIGRTAARVLLDRVLNRRPSSSARHIYLKPELVLRQSTAAIS